MSKPKAMTKTEIAEYGMDVTIGAAFYIRKLSKDRALVKGLQPEPHTRWARAKSQIFDQLDLYQETLLQPAIQGVFLQQPGNLITAKLRDKLRTDWDRLRGVRPVPSQSIYQRILPPSVPDSRSVSREPPSCPRFADEFPDEQHNIAVNRKPSDSTMGSNLPLDNLTNLANCMDTQMTAKLDALAGTLMDRLSQLQDEIIRQVRDQWQHDLAGAMQQLQDANHALAETDGLPNATVVPQNTTPIAAQYSPHPYYLPPKDQPLEPFSPSESQFEINLQSESYCHDNSQFVSDFWRIVNKETLSPNTSASASPTITAQHEDSTPVIAVQDNERIPTPSEIRASGGVVHGSWREGDHMKDDLPGQAVLRATKAILEANRRVSEAEQILQPLELD